MSSIERIVIVGGGLAGGRAAEALRTQGYEGRLDLIGEEPVVPYQRPPLSKGYLRGEVGLDKVHLHPAAWYDEHRIDLHRGTRVASVDPRGRTVTVDDGRRLGYDRLLLTTGSRPRRLAIDGGDLPGVHELRTLADAERLRTAARAADHVIVIGGGWIGSEVAASLRMMGRRVTMVVRDALPLARALGPAVASVYRDLHVAHGVELRLGTEVGRILGTDRVAGVETRDGTRIDGDLVVAGVGALPRVELARTAGLEVADGIVVGPTFETTAPGVFAAGDVAAVWRPAYGRHLRIEHWAEAKFGGPAAARAMLGATEPDDRVPYFYSDQYELGMEYRGLAADGDRIVFRGDPAGGRFLAFWLRDDRLTAAMNANIWDVGEPLEALIRSGATVSAEELADPSIDLAALASPPATAGAASA